MIRNAAKALITRDGEVLLNTSAYRNGEPYYTIPGGGQNHYEAIEDAVRRECLEETGYAVTVKRLACLYEEIDMDEERRKRYPDHTHRIFFVFLCEPDDAPPTTPAEMDDSQTGTAWVPIEELPNLPFEPKALKEPLMRALQGGGFTYLGTTYL